MKSWSGVRGATVAIRGLSRATLAATTLLVHAACGGSAITTENPTDSGSQSQVASLTVSGVTLNAKGAAVPGAIVCLERGTSYSAVDPVACTASWADGAFTLSDPQPTGSASLTLRAEGFLPLLYPFTAHPGDVAVGMAYSTLTPDSGTLLGVAIDSTKGQVPFVVRASGSLSVINVFARATVLDLLTGYSGPRVPATYADASGLPLVGATSGASGAFVNLSPGLYAMQFEAPGSMCTAGVGMLGSTTALSGGGAVFYVDVRGGYELAPITVNCFVP